MKEYLLLRNNTESGPYSVDELRVMGLKAYDLVWVQDKSFSWKYPSEVNELSTFAPPLERVDNAEEKFGNKTTTIKSTDQLYTKDVKEETPIKHISHIVAIKPKVDHIQIRTIKSATQPKIVKVQIRGKDLEEHSNMDEVAYAGNVHYKEEPPLKFSDHNIRKDVLQETHKVVSLSRRLETIYPLHNNRMEMIVLIIGAASLLAVAYLFVTTGY